MAQAVATHHAARAVSELGDAPWVHFSSAGTSPGLLGSPCDPRARAALQRKGYAAPPDRCRRIASLDFERYDLILAMDGQNLADLQQRCPQALQYKVRLFLDYAPLTTQREVPDPYYGDAKGFDRVLELCEQGAIGLIKSLREHGRSI